MPKMTVQEFAAKLKQTYPAYANVPDDTLVMKMIQKYPVYGNQVHLDTYGASDADALSMAGHFLKGAVVNPIKAAGGILSKAAEASNPEIPVPGINTRPGQVNPPNIEAGERFGRDVVQKPMEEQFKKGFEAQDRGNNAEGLARFMAATVPVAGPGVADWAEGTGQAAGAGDWNALAERAGEAASPEVLPRVAGAAGKVAGAAGKIPVGDLAGAAGAGAKAAALKTPIVGPMARAAGEAAMEKWRGRNLPPPPPPPAPGAGLGGTSLPRGYRAPDLPPVNVDLPLQEVGAGGRTPAGPGSTPSGPTSAPPQPPGPPVDINLPPPPKPGGAPAAGPPNSASGPTSAPPTPGNPPPVELPGLGGRKPPQSAPTGRIDPARVRQMRQAHPDWSMDDVMAAMAEEDMAPTNPFEQPGKPNWQQRWRTGETISTPEGPVQPRNLPTVPPRPR